MTERKRRNSNIWVRFFKRLFFWTALSLAIQFAFLFYIDSVLSPNPISVPSIFSKSDLKLPDGVQNLSVSYDGKMASYSTSTDIIVVDSESGRSLYKIPLNGDGVSFTRWLPDRDKMIYAVYKDTAGETLVGLYVYDADSNQFKNIHRLTYRQRGSRIDDVNFSTLTNLIYFKVSQPNSTSLLYKVDILSKLTQVPSQGLGKISQIALLPGLDTLLVQSSGSIYSIKGHQPSRIIHDSQVFLLGVDKDNRIYLGRGSENGISAIYQSDLQGHMKVYYSLPEPVAPEDITVADTGIIYLANYPQTGTLEQIGTDKSTKTTKYEDSVRVCGGFVLSQKPNGVSIAPLPRT